MCRHLKLIIQHIADIHVESISQREAVVVPRIILGPKSREFGGGAPFGEILIREVGIVDKAKNVGAGRDLPGTSRHWKRRKLEFFFCQSFMN